MRKQSIGFILLSLLEITITFGQTNENWVPVSTEKEKILYVNVNGLSAYQDDQIYVWVMEELSSPMKMEEIKGKIIRAKSYYIISKELKKYSLMDVVYYDEDGNVLKSYHYERNYEDPQFKFSSPIIKNSDMEKVFAKCLEVINPANQ